MSSPRLRKILVGLALVATVLAVLTASLVTWLVTTEPGARWGFERVDAYLPGTLRVGTIRGRLLSRVEVRQLRYETDRVQISIERLALDWDLRRLALRRLDIRSFDADSVRVVVLTPQEEAAANDTLKPELPDVDLPLDVMVRSARIRDLYITSARAESAFVINEITLASGAFRDTIGIGALVVRMPLGRLELQGLARPNGRYAVDLSARWSFRTAGGRDLRGDGRLVGNLDTLRIVQDVREPFRAHVDARTFLPLRHPHFTAAIDFVDLDPRSLSPGLPSARARGRLLVSGTPDTFTTRGTADVVSADWGILRAAYRLDFAPERIRVDELAVTQPGRPDRLVARGTVITVVPEGHAPSVEFAGEWRELGLPLTGTPVVTSPKGAFRLTGTTARYRLSANAQVATAQIPPSPLRVSGNGGPNSIAFHSIQSQMLAGSIRGTGRVAWGSPVEWNFTLAARDLDPSAAWPQYPGNVGFDVNTRGQNSDAGLQGVVDVERLSGQVRERPVSGGASLGLVSGGVSVSSLELAWGTNRLTGSGTLANRWDFLWDLQAPDISVLPDADGSIVSRGHVSGTAPSPRIEGSLQGDSLRWKLEAVNHLKADADIDLSGARDWRVELDASGIHALARSVEHAALRGTGRRSAHDLQFSATAGSDSLRVALRGGLSDRDWNGRLTALDLVSEEVGSWSLDSTAAALAAGPSGASLRGFAWRSGDSRLRADAAWKKEGTWSLTTLLERIRLAILQPVLPSSVELAGEFGGSIDAHGVGRRVVGDARIDLGPGEVRYPIARGKRGVTPLDPGTFRAQADGSVLSADASLSFGSTGTFRGNVRMPQAPNTHGGVLDGAMQVHMTDLGLVQAFVPELSATRGQLDAELRVAGTTGRPRWSGEAKLTGGAADVPRYGLELRDAVFEARSNAEGRLVFDGGVRSGPGHISVKGEADLAQGGIPRATASIAGDRFEVSKTSNLEMVVSPDLHVAITGDSARLTGEVVIPQADIRDAARSREALVSSEDVVYVGADSTRFVKREALRLTSTVRVVLGDRVRVRASGLDAKPTGSVLAIDNPDMPTSGSGELRLTEGTYKAYGQDLKIERGRLIFGGGPIANPGLDIRAARHAKDGVVAGFEVTGTLESPRFSLFSEPPMSERDALAYVVLGHRMNESNESEAGIVTSAANSLGLSGGNLIASSLARKFGIEEATVQTEGTIEQASLMLGTYLSPRVYVNYGIGILDPVSTLRIQYFLNSKWTLQAETGNESSGGVLYTIEK